MMIGINRYFLIVVIILSTSYSFAQYAANVSYAPGKDSSSKEIYIITYDLIAPYNTIPCHVAVRLSNEELDMSFVLEDVTGDVGDLIYPGTGKKIIWDHVRELVHFSGSISLSLEVVPSIKVSEKVKKGKTLKIALAPILAEGKAYEVRLYRKQQEVYKLSDLLINNDTVSVSLPKKVQLKGKYQVRIIDGENQFYTNTFRIRPKVGYGWKITPFLLIPVYFLYQDYQEANEPLPGPPTSITN